MMPLHAKSAGRQHRPAAVPALPPEQLPDARKGLNVDEEAVGQN